MSRSNSTTPAPSGKPAKPYPDFPLTAHPVGQWCKKIRGRLYYFGKWDDPDAALDAYLKQKDDLHAGKKPRPDAEGVTVKDVANAFLNHKKSLLDAGELSPHTWAKYKTAADETIAHLGKSRLAADLDSQDFAALRERMAAKWGLHRLADMIQHVRSIFKHGYDAGLIPVPTRFGPGFARPTKKAIRLHKAQQGPRLFTAEEIGRLLDTATVSLRAMILLGINAGMGNADCANLPLLALDLDKGWLDFPRPKTGVARRCPLWPETMAALRDVLAKRPEAKSTEDAGLVFLTKYGDSWAKESEGGPITKETRKLMNKLGINSHRNFYTLRHTFRTVADESKDQPAVDFIMGHEVPHMSAVYRETISDARLRAVADHVHGWLFPSSAFVRSVE
ncbi:MAG TPA: tyrosine-type recombinase/integrase [Gemmataceae bacterium]|jgi:integrase